MRNPQAVVNWSCRTSTSSSRHHSVPVWMSWASTTFRACPRQRRPCCVVALALFLATPGADSGAHAAGASIHVYGLTENALLLSFQAPFQGASAAVVSPDQKTVLAIGGSELQVALWGLPKGDPLGVFTEEWMMEPRYVSLARDGKARFWWSAESGEPWPEGRPAPTGTRSEPDPSDHAILAPDGRLLLTYGPSGAQRNVHLLAAD